MANKVGRNKKVCDKYKASGTREANKRIKQARHEKRMARFAKRKEEGKTYTYEPNPYEKDSKAYLKEAYDRSLKNVDHRLPLAKMTSLIRKVEDQINKEIAAAKELERAKKHGKNSK